jgi:periplasmic copper chaperone A
MKMRVALVLAALLSVGNAGAYDYKVAGIEIDRPWSRATPRGAKVASGYVRITNTGATPDRLVGASFALSPKSEIHEMSMDQGVMKMRELKSGVEIAPGATVELKPGSNHLMFTNLTRGLAKGDRVTGTLTFEKAGSVEVEYVVEAIGATPPQHGAHKH